MDLGKCFNDAIAIYKRNFVLLVLAAFLYDALSVITLLILAVELALTLGPLVIVPGVGEVLAFFTTPLAWLIVTSAYLQQTGETTTAIPTMPPTASVP